MITIIYLSILFFSYYFSIISLTIKMMKEKKHEFPLNDKTQILLMFIFELYKKREEIIIIIMENG